MKFEQDEVEFLGGLRHGLTLGSPVAVRIGNSEWPKWTTVMSPEAVSDEAYAAFILAGVYGVARLVLRRGSRKDDIAFGPWMLLGLLLSLVVQVRPLF
jgi:chorismate synthase